MGYRADPHDRAYMDEDDNSEERQFLDWVDKMIRAADAYEAELRENRQIYLRALAYYFSQPLVETIDGVNYVRQPRSPEEMAADDG